VLDLFDDVVHLAGQYLLGDAEREALGRFERDVRGQGERVAVSGGSATTGFSRIPILSISTRTVSPDHRLRRLLSAFIGMSGLTFVLSGGAAQVHYVADRLACVMSSAVESSDRSGLRAGGKTIAVQE
jgi:hypothetical protein